MATLQDRSTAEMEQAVQEGFDLSWLQKIKDQIPGAADELAHDPTLADNNLTCWTSRPTLPSARVALCHGRAFRSTRPTPSATRRKSGVTT